MENIYPIAKLGNFDQILLINKSDMPFIGKERAMEVMCIMVDLSHATIDEPTELEKHLKFNPWEELATEEDRAEVLRLIQTKFNGSEIHEKIMSPLANAMIK